MRLRSRFSASRRSRSRAGRLRASWRETSTWGRSWPNRWWTFLLKHKPVSRVPVKMDPNPDILINATEMETLGLSFPDSVMQRATMVR